MEKVYVDGTNHATITCPSCKLEKNIDVTDFRDTHKRVKAKCRCGEAFRFTLEFRKFCSKSIALHFMVGKNQAICVPYTNVIYTSI